jgi:PAS domain S-box-containing protein
VVDDSAVVGSPADVRRRVDRLAVESAGIGTFDWELATGRLTWDAKLREIFGFGDDAETTMDAFYALVHPEDRDHLARSIDAAVETLAPFEAEYRVDVPGRGVRWISARGQVALGPDGSPAHFLGAALDFTERQQERAQLSRMLETLPTAFFSLDDEWRFTYVNLEAERVLGRRRDELLGAVVWDLFPAAVDSPFEEHYRHAVETGEPVSFDAYYPAPLDAWYDVRASPSPGTLAVYFLDVTTRRRAEADVLEAARRAELLADVTAALNGTLDGEEAVALLARLTVPVLADWSIVTVVDETPSDHTGWRRHLRDVSAWHADPQVRERLQRYAELRIPSLDERSPLAQAYLLEQSQLIPTGATEHVQRHLGPGEAHDLLSTLGAESMAFLPLVARDHVVGTLTLANGPGREPLQGSALQIAEEIAAHAAVALENSRLYREQRGLAEELQRSLLTAPPHADALDVAVRYVPAARVAQVGGDWYDGFRQDDDTLTLVIGDVIGHDIQAAAAMGKVRTLVRAMGVDGVDGPADVLRRTDRVMQKLGLTTTATVVVARLEDGPDGDLLLRWSNAGHPPPLVVTSDGHVDVLGETHPDVLLGIDADTRRTERTTPVAPGSTLVMYTDGLVERRGQDIDEGISLLAQVLGEHHHLSVDALANLLLTKLLPSANDDDVALMVVRHSG